MMSPSILNAIVGDLRRIVGDRWVIDQRELIESYLRDETPDPVRPKPAENLVLVKPSSTEEVSLILKIANSRGIPVFPVGGRTGLVGGAVPTEPGIILSLERMNRIEVDRDNLMAVAEAGATLADLIKAAEDAGLFFPPHPGDEGAQIGGLIATNAGGSRAIKYGVMRNYIKGLEVVLPTGEILSLGGKTLKNNVGYDLMQLIIGSEGTLCVITKAVIRLFPKSRYMLTLVIPFNTRSDALKSVPAILRSGVTPLAIEYVQINEVLEAARHLNESWPVQKGFAQLIIILDGMSQDEVLKACEELSLVCEANNALDILLAETPAEQSRILKIRSSIYTALKPNMIDILDVTVPPSCLEELMNEVDAVGSKYRVYLPVYGHAGDGNLHVHIMKEGVENEETAKKIKDEIYERAVRLGGTITGEHGIGKIRLENLHMVLSEKHIDLLRSIKRVFDPNNILNPRRLL
ncbi:MAG: FAD-binding oxidoreductase [Candidatus Bathyarchaeota archaeon]|nr:FAD-binding oxidoreductase [Candidatus Bathyarchaeota archaeon]